MKNSEIKRAKWDKISSGILDEIGDKFEITVTGLDENSKYYHPIVKLQDKIFLKAQCDIDNDYYYAVRLNYFTTNSNDFEHELSIELKAGTFKEAIIQYEKHKIKNSIDNTFREIQEIQNSIRFMNDLVKAKIKLLNNAFKLKN
jgi:hypothetical protein